MDDLYRENILEHYKQPRNFGELPDPDLEFEDNNPLCGDELRVQLNVGEDNRISEVRFSGHGCAISQASASMASEEVVGMPVEDLIRLDRDFVLDLLGIDIGHPHEVRAADAQGAQVSRARPRGGVGVRHAAERRRAQPGGLTRPRSPAPPPSTTGSG
jgi:nitrogen fixation NifU-like protein